MLSHERIQELSSGEGVRRMAVFNFLSTLGQQSKDGALRNLELDAQTFSWNAATRTAIWLGINEHFALSLGHHDSICV